MPQDYTIDQELPLKQRISAAFHYRGQFSNLLSAQDLQTEQTLFALTQILYATESETEELLDNPYLAKILFTIPETVEVMEQEGGIMHRRDEIRCHSYQRRVMLDLGKWFTQDNRPNLEMCTELLQQAKFYESSMFQSNAAAVSAMLVTVGFVSTAIVRTIEIPKQEQRDLVLRDYSGIPALCLVAAIGCGAMSYALAEGAQHRAEKFLESLNNIGNQRDY